MFLITYNFVWALTFYFFLFYTTVVFSIILYILPQLKVQTTFSKFKCAPQTKYTEGVEIHLFLVTFVLLAALVNYAWVSPSITTWFGHIVFTSFQRKFVFLSLFIFYLCTLFFTSNFVFGPHEIHDYYITCINFYLWLSSLFMANTLFSVVFFIEIMATLILLLVTTSTFSTSYFYSNLTFNLNSYQNTPLAVTYFTGLLFFFWVSLLASVNLFLFLTFFYTQFLTFDWNSAEFLFTFMLSTTNLKLLVSYFFVYLFLFFCVFLKCGLVPFYFWKPTFFKGLPVHALFYYVVFYYFFIFLFFVFLFFFYLNEIFYTFALIFNLLLLTGFFALFAILCESYYLKVFLALSSILNTLFVFLVFGNLTPLFYLLIL